MDDLLLCSLDRIDRRAALLDRLLDGHPGRDLLAEYEIRVLERPGLAEGYLVEDPSFRHDVEELLARIDKQIADLSTLPSTA